MSDQRNMGGEKIIHSQLRKHQQAVKKAKSFVGEQNRPPHAHITKVVGDKTDFGRGFKKHHRRKGGSSVCKTVLTRELKHIDSLLHQQDNFIEVREAFRRVKEIKQGVSYTKGSSVNNTKPVSFSMTKKLTETKNNNHYAINEHIKNLAALQRHLS